ncbi:exodeoxyribonuclease I [Pantoea sp. Aalb]|uniref:exodeoxyribonuclease I n=1 Tax=Pantoea sp. Aalb TaxID=2576762 RepID=UPI001329726B|nr:exodeoxyribonuclease I [Pantoea sp. Aalb]MXP67340.1 exodeoxyribonuclease I [Pantoea sp. Aalb]
MSNCEFTFLFHDYETFGKDPSLDRPAQFASLRTDKNFNVIEEPILLYCQTASDYLPKPEAVIITGITPQIANKNGVKEATFAKHIHNLFTKPKTCIIGYNNVYFDDEITRNVFYRNFYDPYSWSWKNGNSRWDLLNVMRTCYALRPDGIIWPKNNDGFPSFKLEKLTKANGLVHKQKHNAMSDVYATQALAKLVKEKKPKLFNFLFTHRNKLKIKNLINISQMNPLIHISSIFGASRSNVGYIVPLAWHPYNCNALIVADLSGNITSLLTLKINELAKLLYTPCDELGEHVSLPIKIIYINKCPILMPVNILRLEDIERLGINQLLCLKNLVLLREHIEIQKKIKSVFINKSKLFIKSNDVDTQLYQGFFSNADRNKMNILLKTIPKNLATVALDLKFDDKRINKLLFRYRARNFPDTLDYNERQDWNQHCRSILNNEYINIFLSELKKLVNENKKDAKKIILLRELYLHFKELITNNNQLNF